MNFGDPPSSGIHTQAVGRADVRHLAFLADSDPISPQDKFPLDWTNEVLYQITTTQKKHTKRTTRNRFEENEIKTHTRFKRTPILVRQYKACAKCQGKHASMKQAEN